MHRYCTIIHYFFYAVLVLLHGFDVIVMQPLHGSVGMAAGMLVGLYPCWPTPVVGQKGPRAPLELITDKSDAVWNCHAKFITGLLMCLI